MFKQSITSFVRRHIGHVREDKQVREWENQGRPVPPPHLVKERVIKEYAKRYSIDALIETGTYLGFMVDATRTTFKRIISIELDPDLYAQAQHKFKPYPHITILQGDSSEILPNVMADIKQPCLFWFDGHYSAGITARGTLSTPIMQELKCVLSHSVDKHVMLIDDARLFDGSNDYPRIEELKTFVASKCPDWNFETKDDIIRVHG